MASTAASLHGNRASCAPDLLLQPQLQPPSPQPPLDRQQQQQQSPRTVTTNSAMSSSGCHKRHHVLHSLPYSMHAYDNDAAASGQLPWNALPVVDQASTCRGGGGYTLDECGSYGYSCDFSRSCTCNTNSSGCWLRPLQRSWQQRSVSEGSLLPIISTTAVPIVGGYQPLEPSPNRTCTSGGGTPPSLSRTRSASSTVLVHRQQQHHQPYYSHHQHHDPKQYQYRQQHQQPLQQQHPHLVFSPDADGPAAAGNSSKPQPLGGHYGSSDAAAAGAGNHPQPHIREYEPLQRPMGQNQPHGPADEHSGVGAFSHAIITTTGVSPSARGGSAERTQCFLPLSHPNLVDAPCLPLHGLDPRGPLPPVAASPLGVVDAAAAFISACEGGVPSAEQRLYLAGKLPAGQPPAWAPYPTFRFLLQEQQPLHQQQKKTGSWYAEQDELVPPDTPPPPGEAVQRMQRCDSAEAQPLTPDAGSIVTPPPPPSPTPSPPSWQPLHRPTVERAASSAPFPAKDASAGAGAAHGKGRILKGVPGPGSGQQQQQQVVVHVLLRLSPVGVQQALLQPAGAQAGGGEVAATTACCSSAGSAGISLRAVHVPEGAAVSGAAIRQQVAGGSRAVAASGRRECKQREAHAPRQLQQVAVEGEGQQGRAPCRGDGGGGGGGFGGQPSHDLHAPLASVAYGSVAAMQGSGAVDAGPNSAVESAAAVAAATAAVLTAAGAAVACTAPVQRSTAGADSRQPEAGCTLLAARRPPEPERALLVALESRLEAATATASVAAASAAIHAVPYPMNALLARPPPDALPHVSPKLYFDPGGSLLQGAVLQAACHVIRLAQLRNRLALLPPGRTGPTADDALVDGFPGFGGGGGAAGSCGVSSGAAAHGAAPAPPASVLEGRRCVPVTAVLKLLTRFVSAARALEQAEAQLLGERSVVTAHHDAVDDAGAGGGGCCSQGTLPPGGGGGVAVGQRGTALKTIVAAVEARGALCALRPLMLRGREGAVLLLQAAERALA